VIKNRGEIIHKPNKSQCLDANYFKGVDNHGQRTVIVNYSSSGRGNGVVEDRITLAPDKALTLTAAGYSNRSFTGVIQVNPSTEAGGKQPYNQNRVYHPAGKSRALTAAFAARTNVLLSEVTFRKLTVTECKRLQTVPDDYKMNVSNSQAYKMLGNGWTVDVIVHILSGIAMGSHPLTHSDRRST
jgi:site-specific DNA-cytosine methylase